MLYRIDIKFKTITANPYQQKTYLEFAPCEALKELKKYHRSTLTEARNAVSYLSHFYNTSTLKFAKIFLPIILGGKV